MSTRVRLALVGAGRMGSFHARALAGLPDIAITAVVDPAPEAAALASELGIPDVVMPSELIDADVDGWLVASPTPSHPQLVEQALERGMPVLCEKPLSLDLPSGRRIEAMDAEGLVQVGFWRRFAAPWARAKAMLDAGAIGTPVFLRLSQWDGDPPPAEFCDPAVSGGLAVDCGIHEFDLIEWLTGQRATRVLARPLPIVDPAIGEVGDVDNLLVVVEMEAGAHAVVDLSRNARYGDDVRTEVLGSDGALFVDLLPTGTLRIGGPDGVFVVDEAGVDDPMHDGVVRQARAFADRIRGQQPNVPGAGAANRALAASIAAAQSARQDDWVALSSIE